MNAPQMETSILDPNAAATATAAKMKVGVENLAMNLVGAVGFYFKEAFTSGKDYSQIKEAFEAEANAEDERSKKEAAGKLKQLRKDAGTSLLPSLVSPREVEAYENKMGSDYIYSADPTENRRYGMLAQTRRAFERLNAESPNLTPRLIADRAMAQTSFRGMEGGFSDNFQAEQAKIGVTQTLNAKLRDVRSIGDNLRADFDTGIGQWNATRLLRPGVDRPDLEQRDISRRMGLQVQDYAETVTHAGGLASASDMNSVGGYSQLVGAQEGMRQSNDARAMAELLICACHEKSPTPSAKASALHAAQWDRCLDQRPETQPARPNVQGPSRAIHGSLDARGHSLRADRRSRCNPACRPSRDTGRYAGRRPLAPDSALDDPLAAPTRSASGGLNRRSTPAPAEAPEPC